MGIHYDERAAKLRVGQRVTCRYDDAKGQRRTITAVRKSDGYGSGWCVELAPKKRCPRCKCLPHGITGPLDAAWCLPPK